MQPLALGYMYPRSEMGRVASTVEGQGQEGSDVGTWLLLGRAYVSPRQK